MRTAQVQVDHPHISPPFFLDLNWAEGEHNVLAGRVDNPAARGAAAVAAAAARCLWGGGGGLDRLELCTVAVRYVLLWAQVHTLPVQNGAQSCIFFMGTHVAFKFKRAVAGLKETKTYRYF